MRGTYEHFVKERSLAADKYCSLVESEGGLRLLKDLLNHPEPYDVIKELACIVINNCSQHTSRFTGVPPETVYFDN